jgi:hypothetical protein
MGKWCSKHVEILNPNKSESESESEVCIKLVVFITNLSLFTTQLKLMSSGLWRLLVSYIYRYFDRAATVNIEEENFLFKIAVF